MDRLTTHMQVGNAIRLAREGRGMTQRQLSEASGVSLRSITDLELGLARNIGLDRLMGVLAVLGLSLCICDDGGGSNAGTGRPDRNASYEDALWAIRRGAL